jgi:hypothetical protein
MFENTFSYMKLEIGWLIAINFSVFRYLSLFIIKGVGLSGYIHHSRDLFGQVNGCLFLR